MAKLVYEDQGVVCEFVLDAGGAVCTIGRNPTCDIRVNDPSMSRRHAEVHWSAATGAFEVRDLGSSNGTFVNGRPVSSAELRDGDELICGEFRLRLLAGAASGHVAPETMAPEPGFGSGRVPTFVRNQSPAVTNRTQLGVHLGDEGPPETTLHSRPASAWSDSAPPVPTPATGAPDLAAQLREATAQRDMLQHELQALTGELESLRQRAAASAPAEMVSELRQRVDALAREREQLVEYQSTLRAEIEDYHAAVHDRDETIRQLQAGIEALQLSASESHSRYSTLQASREHAEQSAAEARAEADALRHQFDAMRTELASLRAELDRTHADSSNAAAFAEAAAVEREELRRERQFLVESFAELRAEVLQVAEINARLHAEIDRVNAALGIQPD